MGWTNKPTIEDTTDIILYDWLFEFWKAVNERHCAIGQDQQWPIQNFPWAEGTITGVDTINGEWVEDNTVDDITCGWMDGSGNKRWTAYVPGTLVCGLGGDTAPSAYDIILNSDPGFDSASDVYRVSITNNDATKVYFSSLLNNDNFRLNWLNTRSLSNLVGKKYRIIRTGGYSRYHRIPPKPNTWQFDRGNANKAYIVTRTTSPFTITISGQTTSNLTNLSTATEVQTALENLSNLEVGDIRVLGNIGGPYTLLFRTTLDPTVTATGANVTEPNSILYDFTKIWVDDQWITSQPTYPGSPTQFDLIVLAEDNKWYRVAATDSTNISVSFVAQTWVVGPNTEYFLIERNQYWIPEQRGILSQIATHSGTQTQRSFSNWQPFVWYSGLFDPKLTHNPSDQIVEASVIADTSITRNLGGISEICEDVSSNVFDIDLYTDQSDNCEGERVHNPNLWKTFRSIQLGLENIQGFFIEPKSYSNLGAIPNLNIATWLKAAKAKSGGSTLNVQTTSVASVAGGTATISITMPSKTPLSGGYNTLTAYWAMLEENTDSIWYGIGTVTSNSLDASYEFVAGDIGKTIIIAFGWTRKFPRMFRWMHERSYWIPEYDEFSEPVLVPTEEYPGTWAKRLPSTTYAEYHDLGYVIDSSETFINGEAALWCPDSYFAPSLSLYANNDEVTEVVDKGSYAGRSGVGTGWFIPTKQGTITSGGTFWFEDSTAQFAENVLKTHTGTSTGGTTTTLIDTGKNDPLNGFWNQDDLWNEFILEVSFDSGVTYERRPITDYVASTQTITVSPAFSASASAKPYKIRQLKYTRNRWKTFNCTITKSDGTTVTLPVRYNDDNRLYFDTQGFTFTAGWTYAIDDPVPGGVWHRVSGQWLNPTNPSVTQDTRGANWHMDRTENAPTQVTAFGKIRCNDYFFNYIFDEIYAATNVLRWTLTNVSYTTNGELNSKSTQGTGGGTCNNITPNFLTQSRTGIDTYPGAEGYWNLGSVSDLFEVLGRPFALYSTDVSGRVPQTEMDSTEFNTFISNRYIYAQASPPNCLTRNVEIWGYAAIPCTFAPECDINPNSNCACGEPNQLAQFDANGTGLNWRAWGLLEASGPTTDTIVEVVVGNVTHAMPNASCYPAENPFECDGITPFCDNLPPATIIPIGSVRGFAVIDEVAIIKWDVSGGLEYID